MVKVLIDTSAWIEFLRDSDERVVETIRQLVRSRRAVLCSPVLAEILQGTRSELERDRLTDLFGAIESVNPSDEDWATAGRRLAELRQRGITLPLMDALIASIADRRSMQLLTLDRHFEALGVERYAPR